MDVLFQSRLFQIVRRFQTGRSGKPLERHVILHPGAVCVLPILPDGRVILIKQYRVAVDKTLIELPAGTREPNEEPIVTAGRELSEETGYRAGKIEHLTTFYTSPGILHEEMHLFLASDLQPGETDLEDGEDIERLILDWDEIKTRIASGEIQDGKTLAGLMWYMSIREGDNRAVQ